MDNTAHIHCEVGTLSAPSASLFPLPDYHNPKVAITSETVRICALILHSPLRGNTYDAIVIVFLGFRLFDDVHLLTIDCPSRVCPRQHLHDATIFRNQTFIEVVRIAVWNRNKVAVVTAIILWVINAAFFIQCKSLLHSPAGHRKLSRMPIWVDHSDCACEYPIPHIFKHVLIPFLASLCTGICHNGLRTCQHREH